MAKKKSKKGGAARVKAQAGEHARKVWLAGLGALAAAEAEGGKLFATLVARGEEVERRGKPVVDDLATKASRVREKAKERAKASWTRLGSALDEGLAGTLHRLGVPTREEFDALAASVEALGVRVDALAQEGTQRAPRRKPRKTARKKAAPRRPRRSAASPAPADAPAADAPPPDAPPAA